MLKNSQKYTWTLFFGDKKIFFVICHRILQYRFICLIFDTIFPHYGQLFLCFAYLAQQSVYLTCDIYMLWYHQVMIVNAIYLVVCIFNLCFVSFQKRSKQLIVHLSISFVLFYHAHLRTKSTTYSRRSSSHVFFFLLSYFLLY